MFKATLNVLQQIFDNVETHINDNMNIARNEAKITNALRENTLTTNSTQTNETELHRAKRQLAVPLGFRSYDYGDYYGPLTGDYNYDYYDWVCSETSCQLCNILGGECCDPSSGPNCFLQDSCLNNPCLAGGSCVPTRTIHGQDDFLCICLPGLTGKYCQITNDYIVDGFLPNVPIGPAFPPHGPFPPVPFPGVGQVPGPAPYPAPYQPAPYQPAAPQYQPAAPQYQPAAPQYQPAPPAPQYQPAPPAPQYQQAPAPAQPAPVQYQPAQAPAAYQPSPAPLPAPAPAQPEPVPNQSSSYGSTPHRIENQADQNINPQVASFLSQSNSQFQQQSQNNNNLLFGPSEQLLEHQKPVEQIHQPLQQNNGMTSNNMEMQNNNGMGLMNNGMQNNNGMTSNNMEIQNNNGMSMMNNGMQNNDMGIQNNNGMNMGNSPLNNLNQAQPSLQSGMMPSNNNQPGLSSLPQQNVMPQAVPNPMTRNQFM